MIDGVDKVFDQNGGDNFKRSVKSLKPGGKLIGFGFYNAFTGKGRKIPFDFMKLQLWNILPNQKSTGFYSIGGMRKRHPEWFKEDLHLLFELLGKGSIKPEIADHYPLNKAIEAHKMIENATNAGKIIFDVS